MYPELVDSVLAMRIVAAAVECRGRSGRFPPDFHPELLQIAAGSVPGRLDPVAESMTSGQGWAHRCTRRKETRLDFLSLITPFVR